MEGWENKEKVEGEDLGDHLEIVSIEQVEATVGGLLQNWGDSGCLGFHERQER